MHVHCIQTRIHALCQLLRESNTHRNETQKRDACYTLTTERAAPSTQAHLSTTLASKLRGASAMPRYVGVPVTRRRAAQPLPSRIAAAQDSSATWLVAAAVGAPLSVLTPRLKVKSLTARAGAVLGAPALALTMGALE